MDIKEFNTFKTYIADKFYIKDMKAFINADNYLTLQNAFLDFYPITSSEFSLFRYELSQVMRKEYGDEYILCIKKKSIDEKFTVIDYNRLEFQPRYKIEFDPMYWQCIIVCDLDYSVKVENEDGSYFERYGVFEKSKQGVLKDKISYVHGHLYYNKKYKSLTIKKMIYDSYYRYDLNLNYWEYGIDTTCMDDKERKIYDYNTAIYKEYSAYLLDECKREIKEKINGVQFKSYATPYVFANYKDPSDDFTEIGFYHIGIIMVCYCDKFENVISNTPDKHDALVMHVDDFYEMSDEEKDAWVAESYPYQDPNQEEDW